MQCVLLLQRLPAGLRYPPAGFAVAEPGRRPMVTSASACVRLVSDVLVEHRAAPRKPDALGDDDRVRREVPLHAGAAQELDSLLALDAAVEHPGHQGLPNVNVCTHMPV